MTDYQKYINALRKCAKEHENDTTYTGHIVVSALCKDTANLLETLEHEPFKPMVEIDLDSVIKQKYIERDVLDKIRAEIMQEYKDEFEHPYGRGLRRAIEILDKYKAESGSQESEDNK